MQKLITGFQSVLFFIVLNSYYSCKNSHYNIPFPDDESEFLESQSLALVFQDTMNVKWTSPAGSNYRPAVVKKFEIKNLPSRPLVSGLMKPLHFPADVKKIDWANLPDSVLDIDKLPDQALKIKSYILPKPRILKTMLPRFKENVSGGIFQLGRDEGLPGEKLTDMLQDKNGLIWAVINGRLCRYNGEYVEQFNLAGNKVISRIMLDNSGLLWASTYSGGFYVIDHKNQVQNHISNLSVVQFHLLQDNQNRIWIGTVDEGIYIINWDKATMKNFRRYKGKVGLNAIYNLLQVNNTQVWTAGLDGVWVFDLANKKIKYLNSSLGFQFDAVGTIKNDSKGKVWISPSNYLKSRIDSRINVISSDRDSVFTFGKAQGLDKFILNILEVDHSQVWLTADDEIYIMNPNLDSIRKIVTNEKQVDNDFGSIIEDNQGQVWVGTRTGGIYILNAKGLLPEYLDAKSGLSGSIVWSLAEDDRKKIWIGGTSDPTSETSGFVNLLDSAREKVYDLSKVLGKPFYQSGAIIKDKKGRTLLSIASEGLFIFDQDNKIMIRVGKEQGLPIDSLSEPILLEDRNGFYWISTGKGLVRFDPSSGLFLFLNSLLDFKTASIYCLFESSSGQIWIGTMEQGLYIIDSTRQKVERFFWPEGDQRNNISSLAEDSMHRIWAATNNGVFVFDRINNQYFILNSNNGLIGKENYMLRPVKDRMYIGSLNGLSILTEKPNNRSNGDKSFRYKYDKFDRKNGLLYRDFHSLSLKSSDNKLWFPIDLKVLAVVNEPEEISLPFPAFITGIKILDSSMVFSDFSFNVFFKKNTDTLWDTSDKSFYAPGKLPVDTSYQKNKNIYWDSITGPFRLPVNLKLPYTQNYLSFQFNLLTYNNRANIRYRYILEGIDLKWREITAQSISENYRDLNPGKYIFKVSGSNANGIWSKPAELSFTILPPWWQTWWAYLIYTMSFILIIRAYTQFRSRKLTNDKLQLENKIQIRTKELAQSLKDLKSAQSQIIQSEKMASLGELTAGIAHEIQNPLNFVNNFSDLNQDLIDELNDELDRGNSREVKIIAESIKENEAKINLHGKRADSIVKGMLQHSRASTGLKEPTDLNALADEYLRLAYHGLRAKDNSFNATFETDFDNMIGKVPLIQQDIGRVLLNLYNNAFYAVMEKKKHADKTYEPVVSVRTKMQDGKLILSVSDNGMGIPDKIKEKIFQPFFTTKPTGQGTGLGLSLSYDIIKAHGGELEVNSFEGGGADFVISLPI